LGPQPLFYLHCVHYHSVLRLSSPAMDGRLLPRALPHARATRAPLPAPGSYLVYAPKRGEASSRANGGGRARAVPRPKRDRCRCVAHPWSWVSDAAHRVTVVTSPLRERDMISLPLPRRRLDCAARSAYMPDVIARGEGGRSRHYVKGRWLRLPLPDA
jgi:hypothetical protein